MHSVPPDFSPRGFSHAARGLQPRAQGGGGAAAAAPGAGEHHGLPERLPSARRHQERPRGRGGAAAPARRRPGRSVSTLASARVRVKVNRRQSW